MSEGMEGFPTPFNKPLEKAGYPNWLIKQLGDDPEKIVRIRSLSKHDEKEKIEDFKSAREMFGVLQAKYGVAVPNIEYVVGHYSSPDQHTMYTITQRVHGENLKKMGTIPTEKRKDVTETFDTFCAGLTQYYTDTYTEGGTLLWDMHARQFVYGSTGTDPVPKVYLVDLDPHMVEYNKNIPTNESKSYLAKSIEATYNMMLTLEEKLEGNQLSQTRAKLFPLIQSMQSDDYFREKFQNIQTRLKAETTNPAVDKHLLEGNPTREEILAFLKGLPEIPEVSDIPELAGKNCVVVDQGGSIISEENTDFMGTFEVTSCVPMVITLGKRNETLSEPDNTKPPRTIIAHVDGYAFEDFVDRSGTIQIVDKYDEIIQKYGDDCEIDLLGANDGGERNLVGIFNYLKSKKLLPYIKRANVLGKGKASDVVVNVRNHDIYPGVKFLHSVDKKELVP